MELGVSTLMDFNVPFEARLDYFRTYGIKRIAISDEKKLPLSQRDTLSFIKKAIKSRGLEIDHVHGPISPMLDFTSPDEHIGDATLASHYQIVRACAELDAPVLVVHVSSYPDLKYNDLAGTTKRAIGRLLDLIDYARPHGIDIAIENQPYRYRSQRVIDQVIEEFPEEELKLCLDTCHIMIGNKDPLSFVRRWAEFFITTHLSDSNGLGDDHLIPGAGSFPWEEGIRALKAGGRLKNLTFENSSWGKEPFEPYLERTVLAGRWLCHLWKTLDEPVHSKLIGEPGL